MKTHFIQPRFDGERFEEHTLPVEVARDLAAYETLIVALAKHLYLQEHGDRERVPKGFASDFHLHIETIDAGSARPLLAVVVAGSLALMGGSSSYFERSRDLISECIACVDGTLPAEFPRELLSHFNQIGRSLRDGESMQLPRAGVAPAVLTPDRRKKLVLAVDHVYEKEVELSGTIDEADWARSTFRLRLTDGSQTVVPMPDSFHPKAREFGGRGRYFVAVNGIATYDSWDKLQKVVRVDSLEIQPNYVMATRFDELNEIKDGWHDGLGLAPAIPGFSLVAEKFVAHFPEPVPLPVIVPTQDGNLLIEWDTVGDPTVDVNLFRKTASYHAFDSSGRDVEQDFSLATDADWDRFFAFLVDNVPLRSA